MRDRIILGIRDDKMRERLLRYNDLTLQKAVDLIKAAEQTEHQVMLMGASGNVNVLKQGRSKSNRSSMPSRATNNNYRMVLAGDVERRTQRKNVRHLARSATDVVT